LGKSQPGKRRDGREQQAVDCVRMVHGRRRFYEIHQATASPLAEEALRRIGELHRIEAEIRGHPAEARRAVRQERSRPLVEALHGWLGAQLERVSARSSLAEALRYALRHWDGLVP
jgi:transposase